VSNLKQHVTNHNQFPINHGKRWSDKDIADLALMYYNGTTWNTIQARLGRSRTSCEYKLGQVRFASRFSRNSRFAFISNVVRTKKR